MADHQMDVSQAVVLYLKHYPGSNDAEFNAFYGPASDTAAREQVRGLLDEVMGLRADWSRLTLDGAGDFVETQMQSRHPELSRTALESLGNFFTYLMR